MRTSRAAVLLVAMVAVVGLAMPVMAATAPTVDSSSDISDGATVTTTDYNETDVSTLNVTTPTGENADVEVAITVQDRDITVYEADTASDDYTLAEENNANSNDLHEFNISHDEFANVPIQANGSTTLEFEATANADDGTSATTNGTFALDQTTHDRTVVVLDQAAIDGDDAATLSASEETDEPGFVRSLLGAESETTYDAEATGLTTDGPNTTHYVYFDQSSAADEFDSAAVDSAVDTEWIGEPEAESGDRIYEVAAIHDGHAAPVFYEEANSDYVSTDNDTHAVYESNEDRVRLELGDDYSNESSVDVQASNQNPIALVAISEVSSAMTQDLSFRQAQELFGVMNAFDAWDSPDWVPMAVLPFVLLGGRRRAAAAA